MQQDEDVQKLNDLDARLNSVEDWKEEMSAKIINRLLEQLTNKLNLNLRTHLPRVA